jgi:uncharacterized membrane protein
MEIFLLLVLILLVVIFNSAKNNKMARIEQKLQGIEHYLKNIQFNGSTQTVTQKTEIITEEIKVPTPPISQEKSISIITQNPPSKEVEIEPVSTVEHKTESVEYTFTETELHIQEESFNKSPQTAIKPNVPKESWYDSFRKNNPDLEKFIGENLVSKIGIAILVIGIAFFVKYAIDQNWIKPIGRVAIGVLCGLIVLGFAHRLHKKFQAFSSVLVAGGIAIFYFTIGIAFHQYDIFGQTAAFIIMLLITSFSVFISIIYDRQELAALSIIGGFATPFMLSTGEGNYQVLFTYLLILDCGMLVLAYLRKWNVINIMTYCFTWLLYSIWLQSKVMYVDNAPYKGAFIFATIFYVVFMLMNIINNIKERKPFKALDLSLLISNTFLFFGFGMQILKNYHPELQGAFSVVLAGFNFICSWLLYKKLKADIKLVYLMIGLTLTFVTLAAPIQLHGNYITLFWALEAVLLIWLAQKSHIALYRFVSVIITILMFFSLLMDWANVYTTYHEVSLNIMLNKAFITGLVSSLSLLAIVILLRKETEPVKYLGFSFNPKNYSAVLKIGFIALLYFTGLFELIYQLNQRIVFGLTIAIIVGSYHLLFFSALNIIVAKQHTNSIVITNYIFNFINVGLFVLIFAVFPIGDFKDAMLVPDRGYVGFVFHYVSLACVVYMVYNMYKATQLLNTPIAFSAILNTILVAIAVIYVSSLELVLHVFQFTISNVKENSFEMESLQMHQYESVKTHTFQIGFPILWGLLAFIFLFFGMKKQNKTLRIVALVLLGITLLKLFTYDIKDASEAGKIVAFIILGVVLLIISFMYQKIKALLIDDSINKATNETES